MIVATVNSSVAEHLSWTNCGCSKIGSPYLHVLFCNFSIFHAVWDAALRRSRGTNVYLKNALQGTLQGFGLLQSSLVVVDQLLCSHCRWKWSAVGCSSNCRAKPRALLSQLKVSVCSVSSLCLLCHLFSQKPVQLQGAPSESSQVSSFAMQNVQQICYPLSLTQTQNSLSEVRALCQSRKASTRLIYKAKKKTSSA